MKLKCQPDDFLVEELTSFPHGEGPFALYRLTKRSLGTPEAVDAILQRWKIPRRTISYGGLKDKHAVTTQYLTIHHGPRRGLKQTNLELVYVGQAKRPFSPQDISGNHFQIVVRDLHAAEVERAQQSLQEVRRYGLPNYFDEQRFGSLGLSGEFAARAWCLGNHERTLWLMLADANEHDRPADRKQKQLLREKWGQWAELRRALGGSPARDVVNYLADRSADFRGAIAHVRVDLRSLYLAAFQSFLWNRVLSEFLRREAGDEVFDVELGPDKVAFFHALPEQRAAELQAVQVPLPSAREKLPDGPLKTLYDQTLSALGLEMRMLRVKYPRDSFFSRGQRAAICSPLELHAEPGPDELYAAKRKLSLSFELPRGSYATILVKRLFPTN